MKCKILILSNLFFILTLYVSAQEIVLPSLDGWEKKDPDRYDDQNLFDYINGAADGFLKYGFEELVVHEYTKGESYISVEIYRHSSPAHAYGIYRNERSDNFQPLNIGTQSYVEGNILNFVQDVFYVKMSSNVSTDEIINAEKVIAENLSANIGRNRALPEMYNFFLSSGKIKDSEHFIPLSFLGYSFLRNAYTVNYKENNNPFSCFICVYKDKEQALDALHKYMEKFGSLPAAALDEGKKYLISDTNNGDVFITIKNNKLLGMTGIKKPELAEIFISKMVIALGDQ